MKNKPTLNTEMSVNELNEWYWYKNELADFCRKNRLKTTGKKPDLKKRIEYFLKTGRISVEKQKQNKKCHNSVQQLPKSIDAAIPDNYTSSELYRGYFKSIIGNHFHFTVYMMEYIKKHPGITFRTYIDEWLNEHERRKNKKYKPVIMKSCEYNQYIRDFFENNSLYSLEDAIKCWKYKKSLIGNNKYAKNDLKILKDNKAVHWTQKARQ